MTRTATSSAASRTTPPVFVHPIRSCRRTRRRGSVNRNAVRRARSSDLRNISRPRRPFRSVDVAGFDGGIRPGWVSPVNTTDALGRTTATLFDALNRVVGTGMDERDAVIDASSGLATITLSGHGLVTGDRALVRAVDGDAHYVGVFTVTRVDDRPLHIYHARVGRRDDFRGSCPCFRFGHQLGIRHGLGTSRRQPTPAATSTTYEYDLRDRLTLESLPDGHRSSFGVRTLPETLCPGRTA